VWYPAPRYLGVQGEISATFRPASTEREITTAAGGRFHYLATGEATERQFVPQAWIKFDVESPEAVASAVSELLAARRQLLTERTKSREVRQRLDYSARRACSSASPLRCGCTAPVARLNLRSQQGTGPAYISRPGVSLRRVVVCYFLIGAFVSSTHVV